MTAPQNNPSIDASEPQSNNATPEMAEKRLSTLRNEVPDAVVQIDSVRADDIAIAVRVTIGLPRGARNSVIVAADVHDESSWAQQLDQVQALAICRTLDGLVPTSKQPTPPQNRSQSPQPVQPQASAEGDHLPEYSWNAFWQTMNSRNISRDQVQQALGKSVQEATPKEAVDALKAAGLLR